MFDGIKAAVVADRPAYFKDFLDNFYNVDVLRPARISDQAWQNSFIVAVGASAYAAWACVDTWLTDFREDLPKIDVPTLVLHGTEDRILPFEATAGRLGDLIGLTVVRRGRPAQRRWTHPDGSALPCSISSARPRQAQPRRPEAMPPRQQHLINGIGTGRQSAAPRRGAR